MGPKLIYKSRNTYFLFWTFISDDFLYSNMEVVSDLRDSLGLNGPKLFFLIEYLPRYFKRMLRMTTYTDDA